MLGRTVGRYRITERIGAGGMGVVSLARDERLDRDVAVKVLRGGTLNEASRRRFRNEACALSRSVHPSIATIHDFDTEDQTDYLDPQRSASRRSPTGSSRTRRSSAPSVATWTGRSRGRTGSFARGRWSS